MIEKLVNTIAERIDKEIEAKLRLRIHDLNLLHPNDFNLSKLTLIRKREYIWGSFMGHKEVIYTKYGEEDEKVLVEINPIFAE